MDTKIILKMCQEEGGLLSSPFQFFSSSNCRTAEDKHEKEIYEDVHMEEIYGNVLSAKRVDLEPPINESGKSDQSAGHWDLCVCQE